MAQHTSIQYARFIIDSIPCIRELPAIQHLCRTVDKDTPTEERDKAVMRAIWAIRSARPENGKSQEALRRLLSDNYELLPKTKAFLTWYKKNRYEQKLSKWETPFSDDGLKWGDTCCDMWYSNAFDHAMTYHITRGWGLSSNFVNLPNHNGWNYSKSYSGYDVDCSVWLAVVEALSIKELAPDAAEPTIDADAIQNDFVVKWGRDSNIEGSVEKRIRLHAIGLLDTVMK